MPQPHAGPALWGHRGMCSPLAGAAGGCVGSRRLLRGAGREAVELRMRGGWTEGNPAPELGDDAQGWSPPP